MRALFLIITAWSIAVVPARAMTGDETAIAMARRMIENMGGAEVWSKANWVHTREDAVYASRPGVIDSKFYWRADAPGGWARLTGPEVERRWAWDANGGWLDNGKETREYTREEILDRLGWWRGEIYVMYVRLAREDDNLRLILKDENSFRVLDANDGSDLGLFSVDANGQLATWSYGYGDDKVDYVYGPLKQFGDISMPAWGTLTNGAFRFFYADARLLTAPPEVDFERPSAD